MNVLNAQMKNLMRTMKNPVVMNVLRLLAILYAGMVAPRLPRRLAMLFNNDLFKVAFLALIVFTGSQDPVLSVLLAIGLTLSMNYLSGLQLLEGFRVEQNTNVYHKCLNISAEDLLNAFGGDEMALMEALRNSNAPVSLINTFVSGGQGANDVAPELSTYLNNFGFSLGEGCSLPPP